MSQAPAAKPASQAELDAKLKRAERFYASGKLSESVDAYEDWFKSKYPTTEKDQIPGSLDDIQQMIDFSQALMAYADSSEEATDNLGELDQKYMRAAGFLLVARELLDANITPNVSFVIHDQLGQIALRQRQFDRAVSDFATAISVAETDSSLSWRQVLATRFCSGIALGYGERYSEARAVLEGCLSTLAAYTAADEREGRELEGLRADIESKLHEIALFEEEKRLHPELFADASEEEYYEEE